mmetsp:Transcript_10901/g.16651  ORF Transcript_10901/g.16651 Transcript_10901/m.16651 type:complete len:116 (+) Transcript_10901:568-915(+)
MFAGALLAPVGAWGAGAVVAALAPVANTLAGWISGGGRGEGFGAVDVISVIERRKPKTMLGHHLVPQAISMEIEECCLMLWLSTTWRSLKWLTMTSGYKKDLTLLLPFSDQDLFL